MLLERLPLRCLCKGHVNSGGLQICMPQRLLNGLKICPSGNMVGGHGMAEGMDTRTSDARFSCVLSHPVLNRPRTQWSLKLAEEQCRLTNLWSHQQPAGKCLTRLMVQRNILNLAT